MRNFFLSGLFAVLPLLSSPAVAQTSGSERLERAVQLLQQRNGELQREVDQLKTKKLAPAVAAAAAPAPSSDKNVVETKTVKEEKKPVYATAAASEFKLTLGGFIQAQAEAGDVFAFEGRFQTGTSEIKDRFRIRRARIDVSGDFAEDFDFKLEGEFTHSDTAVTVRDPVSGATLGSNSTRTSFSATDPS